MSKQAKSSLSHLDAQGTARMVNVGEKADTRRLAVAEGVVLMQPETFEAIQQGNVKKGDVLSSARIAGIMGAKKTAELIPLCHPLPLTHLDIDFELDSQEHRIVIRAKAETIGKTGVEMEALTAVSVAALTIYDMAKALDRSMRIGEIRLLEKLGGQSGHYQADES